METSATSKSPERSVLSATEYPWCSILVPGNANSSFAPTRCCRTAPTYVLPGDCCWPFNACSNKSSSIELRLLLSSCLRLNGSVLKYSTMRSTHHLSMLSSMRSEEHTSELQSHSFISYAVFCLKKK